MTLQQIIEIYGKRLITLESWMQKASSTVTVPQVHEIVQSKLKNLEISNQQSQSNDEVIKEWNARFELIAQELADVKDMVLHLQDYTMSVNKVLLEKGALLSTLSTSPEVYNAEITDQVMSFEYDEGEDDVEVEPEKEEEVQSNDQVEEMEQEQT